MYSSGKSAGAERSQASAVRMRKLAPTRATSRTCSRFTRVIVGSCSETLERDEGAGFAPPPGRSEAAYGRVVVMTIWEDGPAFAAVWFGDVAWMQYEVVGVVPFTPERRGRSPAPSRTPKSVG